MSENANDPMLQFVVDLRQACECYIQTVTPFEYKSIPEVVFTLLNFQAHIGDKIGAYETAQAKDNQQKEFDEAISVLKEAKATISARFHQADYVYSYWLYGEAIYRQKLKQTG